MKSLLIISALCSLLLAVSGVSGATETDPLTGLPLLPAVSNGLDPSKPRVFPEGQLCKSKKQTDFYGVFGAFQPKEIVDWCMIHFAGFRKALRSYYHGSSHDTFYNANGTVVVDVQYSPGKEGHDTIASTITYMKFTPGLSEKTILSMTSGKIVCP